MAAKLNTTYSYTLLVGNLTVSVTKKNIKNINIRIRNNSEVAVSAPFTASKQSILSALEKNMPWIIRTQNKLSLGSLNEKANENDRTHITIFGKVYKIQPCEREKGQIVAIRGDIIYVPLPRTCLTPEETAFEKAEGYAKEKLLSLLNELNQKWNGIASLRAKKITVRRMRTRYGSMNVKTASMNIALCMYEKEPELVEYVTVHELCHLKEANHSARFHSLVAKLLPDAAEREKKLKGKIPTK